MGGPHRHASALVGRVLEGDVEVEAATEIDDPEGQQKDYGSDEREFGHALGSLAAEPSGELCFHGLPWMVKCSLYVMLIPLLKRVWMNGALSAKVIRSEPLVAASL